MCCFVIPVRRGAHQSKWKVPFHFNSSTTEQNTSSHMAHLWNLTASPVQMEGKLGSNLACQFPVSWVPIQLYNCTRSDVKQKNILLNQLNTNLAHMTCCTKLKKRAGNPVPPPLFILHPSPNPPSNNHRTNIRWRRVLREKGSEWKPSPTQNNWWRICLLKKQWIFHWKMGVFAVELQFPVNWEWWLILNSLADESKYIFVWWCPCASSNFIP